MACVQSLLAAASATLREWRVFKTCVCTQTFSRESFVVFFWFFFWASLMENCLFWNGEGLERAHGDNNHNDDDDDPRVLVADIYDLSLSLHTSRRQRCCCSCCNQREKKKKKKNSRWLKTDSPDSDGHTTFFFFSPRQIRIHSAHLSLSLLDSFFFLFFSAGNSIRKRFAFSFFGIRRSC